MIEVGSVRVNRFTVRRIVVSAMPYLLARQAVGFGKVERGLEIGSV